jgi:hypothetical protein
MTNHTPDTERERFKRWANAAGFDMAYTHVDDSTRHLFLNPTTEHAWVIWQAAKADAREQATKDLREVGKVIQPDAVIDGAQCHCVWARNGTCVSTDPRCTQKMQTHIPDAYFNCLCYMEQHPAENYFRHTFLT